MEFAEPMKGAESACCADTMFGVLLTRPPGLILLQVYHGVDHAALPKSRLLRKGRVMRRRAACGMHVGSEAKCGCAAQISRAARAIGRLFARVDAGAGRRRPARFVPAD